MACSILATRSSGSRILSRAPLISPHLHPHPRRNRLPNFSFHRDLNMATQSTTYKLNTGATIPAVGFGTWQDVDAQEEAVLAALKVSRCSYLVLVISLHTVVEQCRRAIVILIRLASMVQSRRLAKPSASPRFREKNSSLLRSYGTTRMRRRMSGLRLMLP